MNRTYEIIFEIALIVFVVGAFGSFFWWRLDKSSDRGSFLFRWAFTAFIVFIIVRYLARGFLSGTAAVPFALLGTAVCGLLLACFWTPAIVDSVARKIGSLYDGGDDEVAPKPFYSIAQAQRSKGKYQRAHDEVRKQLLRFPNDFEGHILLASLEAENLNDMPSAEVTIQKLCSQPGHTPKNLAYALNLLADWHLKINKDRDAAQRVLEQIIVGLPDTEMAVQASQRVAHLGGTELLLAPLDRQRISVTKGVDNIGLLQSSSFLTPGEAKPEDVAASYVKHLEAHPLDTEVREKLAVLYANHYQRMDLAADQLEQLIQMPNQPSKLVIHWLNLLADLQVRQGAEFEHVRSTLTRIIDLYPDIAAAENARRRIDMLKYEFKSQAKGEAIKMGTYEQNIGLKSNRPR